MAGGQEKWYFTKEQLQSSASRKCGLDADKELAYRQQAANLIQDMGQRLQVSQLCINTAIVYMHRFYAFHSFTQFHRNAIAAAALFLAAKVEEQPRKLEYVIKVAHVCLHRGESVNALLPEHYQEQATDLVFNENVLLQTLGFDVAIDHPHTHVVRTCHLVKAPKDLAQTSYFMASNSLHLTTMCLQYRPTVVACFCIHLASKWSSWAIPQSNEGRHWFSYVDRSVTMELLERLTSEFLVIFEKCPSRLKRKMMNKAAADGSSPHSSAAHAPAASTPGVGSGAKHPPPPADDFDKEYERERRRQAQPVPGGYVPATTPQPPAPPPPQKIDYNLYREKREREERERREERDRRQAMQRTAAPRPRPDVPQAATHHRPPHKPHHPWPPGHHKHHQKPPSDHRHHRPDGSRPATVPPQPQPQAPPQVQLQPPPQPDAVREPVPVPQRTRPPSLFSPENATTPTAAAAQAPRRPTPQVPTHRPKEVRPQPQPQPTTHERPISPKKRPDPTTAIREMQPPAILSPFSSPPAKEIKPRQRQQSNSEPELVPVVKKLEETPGYENLIRESQKGSSTKVKPKEQTACSLNGIETDPTLVSNLLKESLAKPVPITVPTERKSPVIEIKKEEQQPVEPQPVKVEEEHKHKKEKKKKDKHKHKDRDKSKEERKKHKKDKEREKKEAAPTGEPQPPPVADAQSDSFKITIPRDKLSNTSPGLKIKIPKDRLAAPPPPPQPGLKIKISKEVLETSRKRGGATEVGPPQKLQRQNGHPKVETAGNGHK